MMARLKHRIQESPVFAMVRLFCKHLGKTKYEAYPLKQPEFIKWARENSCSSIIAYRKFADIFLIYEAFSEYKFISHYAYKILTDHLSEFQQAGGGNYRLIYYLVRKFQPEVVVETGVSAGFSTLAILRAFQKNYRSGCLYSSDLPNAGSENAPQHIGILAQNEPNSACWELDITGDRNALPKIVEKLGDKKIDFFHFDSDKSYDGREFCVNTLMGKFSDDAVVVFDDIFDNFHFRDLVEKFNLDYVVFTDVGVITNFGRRMRECR